MATVVTYALAALATIVALSTVPFLLVAIDYRQRDNGLAYILLLLGVAIWNVMFLAQLMTEEAIVQSFFMGLAIVGAVQAGLGFMLFASTASSTPNSLSHPAVYGAVGVLGGLDITLAITAPVHPFYWEILVVNPAPVGFPAVEPAVGYWFHTVFTMVIFGLGTALFWAASQAHPNDRYPLGYAVAGLLTVIAIGSSNWFAPGGLGIGSIVVGALTTIGFVQASRGAPITQLKGKLR